MFLHFLHGGLVDQRTLEYSRLETVAYFKFFYRGDQFLGKSIINPGLDVKPVRENAVAVSVTKKLNTPGAIEAKAMAREKPPIRRARIGTPFAS